MSAAHQYAAMDSVRRNGVLEEVVLALGTMASLIERRKAECADQEVSRLIDQQLAAVRAVIELVQRMKAPE